MSSVGEESPSKGMANSLLALSDSLSSKIPFKRHLSSRYVFRVGGIEPQLEQTRQKIVQPKTWAILIALPVPFRKSRQGHQTIIMVAAAVLSTATLAGFALLIVLSIVLYRYYKKNRISFDMSAYSHNSKHSSLRDSKRSASSFKSESSLTSIQLPHQKHVPNIGMVQDVSKRDRRCLIYGESIMQENYGEISISREEPQRTPHHKFHPHSLKNQTRHLTESLQHVRLSLPEVVVPSFFGGSTNDSTTSPSQSSHSLPILKQRSSSRNRTGSDDVSDSPPLSASPRGRFMQTSSSHHPEFQFTQIEGAACAAYSSSPTQRSPLLQGPQGERSSGAISPIGKIMSKV
ncbi:hypothetical protein GQR58_011995 [Nymphon striatum]|nr:hypothetical protein GQR58_011995 [Nymphon striatum]